MVLRSLFVVCAILKSVSLAAHTAYQWSVLATNSKTHHIALVQFYPLHHAKIPLMPIMHSASFSPITSVYGTHSFSDSRTRLPMLKIIPVNPEFDSHAQDLGKKLTSDLVRADIDDRDESMGRRVRESEKEWVPYTLVIGEKEAHDGHLSVRDRVTGKTAPMQYEEFLSLLRKQTLVCRMRS